MYIGTPLPLSYVHCVLVAVKLFNFFFSLLGGARIIKRNKGSYIFIVLYILVTQIITFLLNALFIVVQQLDNPFDDDFVGFPGLRYEKAMYQDIKQFTLSQKRLNDYGKPWEINSPKRFKKFTTKT